MNVRLILVKKAMRKRAMIVRFAGPHGQKNILPASSNLECYAAGSLAPYGHLDRLHFAAGRINPAGGNRNGSQVRNEHLFQGIDIPGLEGRRFPIWQAFRACSEGQDCDHFRDHIVLGEQE